MRKYFKGNGINAAKIFLCLLISLFFVFQLSAACFAGSDNADEIHNASGNVNRPLSVDPIGLSEGFSAVLYDNTNGLPTSEANAIAETGEGFIWIGSYAGLIRYDGNTFERMDSTNGITSVTCLFVDKKDRLWIGTNANGVAVMERGEFRIWDRRDGLRSSSIRAVTEDENGTVFAASTSGVAVIDQDMKMELIDDERINTYIRDIRIGADGIVYGLTQSGDLFSLTGKTVDKFINSDDCRIKGIIGILPDPTEPGKLYLGTESSTVYHGSFDSNFDDLSVTEVAPLTYVERFEYIDNQIWICAGDGIGTINGDGFQLLENVPMDNSVCHVMTDYDGNLWFTSTRQGVMKVVPNRFSDIFERYDLPASVVNSTCIYNDRMFIATDSGLTVLESNGNQAVSLPLTSAVTASGAALDTSDLIGYLDGVRIRSIIRDSKNRVWISTWRKYGLLCYDDGKLTAFTVDDGLFSDRVRVVYERSNGVIMAVNTGGVTLIDGGRVIKSFGTDDGIVNTEILTVAEGLNGDIILGSDGGGIYVINDGGTRHIGVDEGLGSEVIMRIKYDSAHKVFWIITTNSIAYMDTEYNVTTVKNFPYPNMFDVYENSRGEVWVLAGNGIYVLPAEELLANGEISPVFYSRDNGLSCITTANSYSELTGDGDLFIAGTTGVVKVNIEKQFENVSSIKAAVPYIEADGQRIYPGASGSFVIPKTTKKLTVFSFVYNYSLMNPQVGYQLEGFDQNMTFITRSELVPVDYTNLSGGTYRFILRLKDSMGQGSREFSFEIVKEKKLIERIWFMILVVLLALFIVEEIVRRLARAKIKKLEKKHRETMTFIREITEAFAKVIDIKDKYTNGHSTRVAKYTTMLAKELGYDDETVEKYYQIALLHDIGKIGVPPEVLNKPGKLTDAEFETIKSHTVQGYDVLKDISIMPDLAVGAKSHHERPDGKGYPNHLKGDEIPRVAQIIAVADCFDAMYSNRPYRNRMNFDKVVEIIKGASGTQLTPDVVDAFLRLVEKGEFRDPDDKGDGSTENIENIRNGG